MKITLNNVAKIKHAEVEIKGITVIAGENNTGKSTVGKALYAISNSFYNVKDQIYNERVENAVSILQSMMRQSFGMMSAKFIADMEDVAKNLIDNREIFLVDQSILEEHIENYMENYDGLSMQQEEKNKRIEYVEQLYKALAIEDDTIFMFVLRSKVDAEFCNQINNIYTEDPAEITLQINGEEDIEVTLTENFMKCNRGNISLGTEVIYLDDPYILDERIRMRPLTYSLEHKEELKQKLIRDNKNQNLISELVTANKFEQIMDKMNRVCGGEIIRNNTNHRFSYKKKDTDKSLDMNNVSAGLKTFVILKRLLLNGNIESNGTVILDEPEIHLHPEWQLLFAELIVLIQKEFGLHILINTHSPYFLNAIEVYSEKYETLDKCKFYLSREDHNMSVIEDVSDRIEAIYEKLAKPLQRK